MWDPTKVSNSIELTLVNRPNPRRMCCIQFPPHKYLQKSTSRWCVLCAPMFWLALSFGHVQCMEGVTQLPVATVEAWGDPKGLATLQHHQSSSAASQLADQFRSAFLLFLGNWCKNWIPKRIVKRRYPLTDS